MFARVFGIAALLLFSITACGSKPIDIGAQIIIDVGPKVVLLTPTDNPNTGGTGSLVKAPSGVTYILTNAHICAASRDGMLAASQKGMRRPAQVKIIDRSWSNDLCLLEGLPGREDGLELAAEDVNGYDLYWILGHPGLKPLTLTEGRIVERLEVSLIDGDTSEEKCVGPNRYVKEIETLFEKIKACIVTYDAYDTSIIIYPGNSGSPVLDSDGKVVGVAFAGDRETNRAAIVPWDKVVEFLALY